LTGLIERSAGGREEEKMSTVAPAGSAMDSVPLGKRVCGKEGLREIEVRSVWRYSGAPRSLMIFGTGVSVKGEKQRWERETDRESE
jgi:hypothetical protein